MEIPYDAMMELSQLGRARRLLRQNSDAECANHFGNVVPGRKLLPHDDVGSLEDIGRELFGASSKECNCQPAHERRLIQ